MGGLQTDDVHCLGFNNPNWEVYYIERGQKSEPIFSSTNEEEAIRFYADFVSRIEHWHLITFTRSAEILNDFKSKLESKNIRTIQNDIPSYKAVGDKVYRLFVVNKDIFTAKEIFKDVPCFDKDLQKNNV
ncbi:MAG: SPOR domain-containing protein [Bacteroidetes bacterium]|nr:SPOR domain-containing protein [Bacteroidota bacterium]